jgi:hypothetical protein
MGCKGSHDDHHTIYMRLIEWLEGRTIRGQSSTLTARDPSAGNLNFERDVGWSSKIQARGQRLGLVPQPLVL